MEAELTVVDSSHSRAWESKERTGSCARLSTSGPLIQHPIFSSKTLPSQNFKPTSAPCLGSKHSLLRACGNVTLPNHNGGLEKEFHLVDYYIKSTHWRLSFQLFSVCVCTRPHALAYTCLCVGTRAQPPVSSSGFHLPP